MSEPGYRRSAAITVALAAVCALVACGEGTPPAAAAAEQARNAIDAYVGAVNAMDLDSAGTFYSDSPDFHWVEDGEVRYRSARESRESLAGLGAMASSLELALSDLSVTGLSADIAVASCRFVQTVNVADAGPSFAFSGAMSIVLRRENGRWLFVAGHTSSVRPRTGDAAVGEPGGRR